MRVTIGVMAGVKAGVRGHSECDGEKDKVDFKVERSGDLLGLLYKPTSGSSV